MGAALMAAAVALGAFGAHALKSRLAPEMLAVFEVGVRYHVYHALALFVVGWLRTLRPGAALSMSATDNAATILDVAGWCFAAGILLFSGSLYAYALTGSKALVMITPLGGLLFIVGWAGVLIGARRV